MRFKEFINEAGRVHTIRNPNIKPKGAPTDPARCFDAKNVDRSALKKLGKDFYAVEGDTSFYDKSDDANEALWLDTNHIMVLVMGGGVDFNDQKYYGINVVFDLEDTKMKLKNQEPDLITSGSDSIAMGQAKRHKAAIIAVALKAIKNGNVPGVKKLDTTGFNYKA